MDKILIKGGKPLLGTVEISGAKNAALPALAATLLTSDAVVLQNVPCVRDIQTTGQMLRDLGCQADFRTLESTHSCRVSASNVTSCEAPYELVKTMRVPPDQLFANLPRHFFDREAAIFARDLSVQHHLKQKVA